MPAFGYENTEAAEEINGILDFNRDNHNQFNKNTTVLPITNYTFDTYSINAQGLGGSFRPLEARLVMFMILKLMM